jgi:hypothetical protein
MEAICLSQADWDGVMSPLMGITLQRCGIASTFPRDLLFTSLQFQGLGVHNPSFQQMLPYLATLVAETANPESATGTLLTVVAEDLRREIGLLGEFTDTPWSQLDKSATHTWLTHLIGFASEHHMKLHDHLPKIVPARAGDQCLMEAFLRGGVHSGGT